MAVCRHIGGHRQRRRQRDAVLQHDGKELQEDAPGRRALQGPENRHLQEPAVEDRPAPRIAHKGDRCQRDKRTAYQQRGKVATHEVHQREQEARRPRQLRLQVLQHDGKGGQHKDGHEHERDERDDEQNDGIEQRRLQRLACLVAVLLEVRELREDLAERAALLARTHEAAERSGKDSRVHGHPLVERPPR